MDVFTYIIMGLLSLDTIRALIAMTGWVKPEAKFSWIIYGRYERNLIVTGLKELGFQPQKSEEISKNLRTVSENERAIYGITEKNAAEQLVILISKYIVYFDRPIQYGGTRTTTSSYYINTMEMSHDEKDKQIMTSIMAHLYAKKGNSSKPEVIITPKGGNPLFAQAVAKHYAANFVVAKSKGDKSRITSVADDAGTDFRINYEGSWNVATSLNTQNCIIVDCNTSGGSQLIDIVNDLRRISSQAKNVKIPTPTAAYVLFRADSGKEHDINQKFQDNKCKLYRFFDLDEELKKQIYQLKQSVGADRLPDLYYADDKKQVDDIIRHMKEKKLFFYSALDENKKINETQMDASEAEKTSATSPSVTAETSDSSPMQPNT